MLQKYRKLQETPKLLSFNYVEKELQSVYVDI